MATVNIPVEVMDEKCAGCKCMDLDKTEYYSGFEQVSLMYSCRNIHMCQYIRNRIVRNEEKSEKDTEGTENEQ